MIRHCQPRQVLFFILLLVSMTTPHCSRSPGKQLDDGGIDAQTPRFTRTLDLMNLTYETERMDILRSSLYFNPRTEHGVNTYELFQDHVAARLMVWEWEVYQSDCLRPVQCANNFLDRLEDRRSYGACSSLSHIRVFWSHP